jgi:hypothetical protein
MAEKQPRSAEKQVFTAWCRHRWRQLTAGKILVEFGVLPYRCAQSQCPFK